MRATTGDSVVWTAGPLRCYGDAMFYGRRYLAALAILTSTSGCATSLTMAQTARTLPPGKISIATNASIPLSTRVASELGDAAKAAGRRLADAASRGEPVTEDEQRQALESGLALALFHPGATTELAMRVVVEDLDLGLRYSGNLVKGEGKLQLATSDDGRGQPDS